MLVEDVNKEVSVLTHESNNKNHQSFVTDKTKNAHHDGIVNISTHATP